MTAIEKALKTSIFRQKAGLYKLKIEQFAEIVDGQATADWLGRSEFEIAALSIQATRFFWFRFVSLSIIAYSAVAFYIVQFNVSASAIKGCAFGAVLCSVSSIVSFLVSEWAFDQPKGLFMGVALGLIIVRMFNLLFAFAVGLFFLKFDAMGMTWGMFIMYFAYLALEVAYVHKKGLLIGE